MESSVLGIDPLVCHTNIIVLKAIKDRMMMLARDVNSDAQLMGDLEEMIDSFSEGFLEKNSENRLNIKMVDEYAMLNFKDIADQFEQYVNRVKYAMGPVKRIVLFIPLKIAEGRVRRLSQLSRRVQVVYGKRKN